MLKVLSTKKETDNNLGGFKKLLDNGSGLVAEGAAKVKNGTVAAAQQIANASHIVLEKGKDAQMAALSYIDKKKNARFLDTKLQSFKDGLKAGKIESVDYIKKYTNFCLAATAVSYFFARCDGYIDEAEMLEIQFDLDSILKNKDLPEAVRNELGRIAAKEDITFDDVRKYLDGVGIETLQEFARDIDEIIFADGDVSPDEETAKAEFELYYQGRLEAEHHE